MEGVAESMCWLKEPLWGLCTPAQVVFSLPTRQLSEVGLHARGSGSTRSPPASYRCSAGQVAASLGIAQSCLYAGASPSLGTAETPTTTLSHRHSGPMHTELAQPSKQPVHEIGSSFARADRSRLVRRGQRNNRTTRPIDDLALADRIVELDK